MLGIAIYTAFSSKVGAGGMWACSLFLSFVYVYARDEWRNDSECVIFSLCNSCKLQMQGLCLLDCIIC